jgi:hypothetical protein
LIFLVILLTAAPSSGAGSFGILFRLEDDGI